MRATESAASGEVAPTTAPRRSAIQCCLPSGVDTASVPVTPRVARDPRVMPQGRSLTAPRIWIDHLYFCRRFNIPDDCWPGHGSAYVAFCTASDPRCSTPVRPPAFADDNECP